MSLIIGWLILLIILVKVKSNMDRVEANNKKKEKLESDTAYLEKLLKPLRDKERINRVSLMVKSLKDIADHKLRLESLEIIIRDLRERIKADINIRVDLTIEDHCQELEYCLTRSFNSISKMNENEEINYLYNKIQDHDLITELEDIFHRFLTGSANNTDKEIVEDFLFDIEKGIAETTIPVQPTQLLKQLRKLFEVIKEDPRLEVEANKIFEILK